MKATARWPRVARENAITALRCAVASWFALWWLNVGVGGRHNIPENLPVGFLAVSVIVLSRDANSLGAWLLLGAVMGIALGIATPLSYGVIIFLRGQDQISRKHFDVALPLTMFVCSFALGLVPVIPRALRASPTPGTLTTTGPCRRVVATKPRSREWARSRRSNTPASTSPARRRSRTARTLSRRDACGASWTCK